LSDAIALSQISQQQLSIDDFLTAAGPILDVRSPSEYQQGHIPGAISLPLFDDAERARVGTCYKQVGREQAVELGFDIAGPKMGDLIRAARAMAPDQVVRVHCWRGGMRSGAIAWMLNLAGFQTITLQGGYKSFRHTLAIPKKVLLLGGMTGTAKTDILHALAQQDEQTLDLEGYANHRGSSYGSLGLPPQPSTEQFENLIASEWHRFDPQRPIWIEAESRSVGPCRVPPELFAQMEAAVALEVTRPVAERVALLVDIYGRADREALITATERIRKRLGGQRTQAAIAHIQAGNLAEAVAITLSYYDRTYRYGLAQREQPAIEVDITELSAEQAAQKLCQAFSALSTSTLSTSTLLASTFANKRS
jgi:tRNA 2-selenouridine synthase